MNEYECYERVLRARLADARFFFEEDRKRTLESRVADLGRRTYQAKLGTELAVQIRGKAEPALVVKRPFYKR